MILAPGPLPTNAFTSIPCSATNLRTTGDNNLLDVATGAGAATTGAGAATTGAGAATTGAGAATTGAAAGAGAAPATPTTAITVPTGTVSPSATRISVRVPEIGEGTSVSTLSVDTSNSGSSAATVSPTFLNQRVMVPSVTVSPSCGSVISAMVLLCAKSQFYEHHQPSASSFTHLCCVQSTTSRFHQTTQTTKGAA
ncbi:unannotated protein [freshwater metagenome]|uniref:Unannotated protein n=1 Tax=freshwater metagenome TaxID=449393 RepID=A0A6J7L9W9_9ZZZZ